MSAARIFEAEQRFVVVDQSLRDFTGHHFEYSVAVAEAAARAGWRPLILAHQAFPTAPGPPGINLKPWFDSAWNERQGEQALRRLVFAVLARLPPPLHDPAYIALSGARRTAVRLRRAAMAPRPHGFGAALVAGLSAADVGPESIAFIHTISVAELESVLTAVQAGPAESLPCIEVVLRRDADEPDVRQGGRLGIAACLRAFHSTRLWPGRVRFHTDTEELRRQYEELSSVRFGVLPIPCRHELLDRAPAQPADSPAIVLFLGGARREKGFHLLPRVAEALASDYLATGRARLVAQSGFNVPGGEPGMAAARARLSRFAAEQVRMLDEALAPADYYALLADASLVLLPYDARLYRTRSSGVLAEALAAGKPVVVPAGTWMAAQIDAIGGTIFGSDDDVPAVVASALRDLPALTAAAVAHARVWRAANSADALVRLLLAAR